ncbi:MAG: metal ABC transporter substrate-binding protein [Ancrocorticia sp.]
MRMYKIALTAACAALALSACSGNTDGANRDADATTDGTIDVATSFYPITWLTEEIGGEAVSVTSMTPANAEPHDFELSPAEIATMADMDAIIYVRGFQPSLDEAIDSISGPKIVDLTEMVDLEPLLADDHDHEGEEHSADDGHDHSGDLDPHFWLDPKRMEGAAEGIAEALTSLSPEGADSFKTNLTAVQGSLDGLDKNFEAGLATCERRTIVTSHAAFGYLAREYDLTQVSISGIDPDREPSPAEINRVKKAIQEAGVTTVFTEELVSPKTSEALAEEAGADVALLSTLEGQPADGNYVDAMSTNLDTLRTALACK